MIFNQCTRIDKIAMILTIWVKLIQCDHAQDSLAEVFWLFILNKISDESSVLVKNLWIWWNFYNVYKLSARKCSNKRNEYYIYLAQRVIVIWIKSLWTIDSADWNRWSHHFQMNYFKNHFVFLDWIFMIFLGSIFIAFHSIFHVQFHQYGIL